MAGSPVVPFTPDMATKPFTSRVTLTAFWSVDVKRSVGMILAWPRDLICAVNQTPTRTWQPSAKSVRESAFQKGLSWISCGRDTDLLKHSKK